MLKIELEAVDDTYVHVYLAGYSFCTPIYLSRPYHPG